MENILKELINSGLSIRNIAKTTGKSYSSIRYWLKKYNLKTIRAIPKEKNEICKLCGNPVRDNDRNRSRCQSCTTRIRRYRLKLHAVKLLGEKCNRCGWSGNIAAFEFHHPNNDKSFDLSRMWNKSWKVMKSEVLKCELLCSNCHRIEHTKYDKDENFMNAVKNYKELEQ